MGLHTFFSEVSTLPKKAPSPSARSRCLGFPPRSNSFAFEPTVQLCSIFSLSGLTRFTRIVRTEIRSNAEGGLITISKKIRRDNRSYPVLFTLDAIRTHDLPLRSSLSPYLQGCLGFARISQKLLFLLSSDLVHLSTFTPFC